MARKTSDEAQSQDQLVEAVQAAEAEVVAKPNDHYAKTYVSTKEKLAAQDKFTIRLRPESKEKPGEQTVQINGYLFQIKRGEQVRVPKSVYDILVEAGEV
jgi:hypothetical protein